MVDDLLRSDEKG
jgi:ABC-type antimicrobial peptide transport system permease subunit